MKIYLAPIQGHTDSSYRFFFNKNFKGIDKFYTPFIRWEKDGLRKRDIKDLEENIKRMGNLVPQVIFRDITELKNLVSVIVEKGYNEIDLNMGCPFPLQTAKGRGAAVIENRQLLSEVAELTEGLPEVSFSVKMRLGICSPDEWKINADLFNRMRLSHITLHPRVAKQQYKGDVDIDSFAEFKEAVNKPLFYNGDLLTVEDIKRIYNTFPDLEGVMIGRGLLGSPTLAEEYKEDIILSRSEKIIRMMDFHAQLLDYYEATLCGDSQILSKIKPFWEYSEELIGRKAYKAIVKAINMAKYRSALSLINE